MWQKKRNIRTYEEEKQTNNWQSRKMWTNNVQTQNKVWPVIHVGCYVRNNNAFFLGGGCVDLLLYLYWM